MFGRQIAESYTRETTFDYIVRSLVCNWHSRPANFQQMAYANCYWSRKWSHAAALTITRKILRIQSLQNLRFTRNWPTKIRLIWKFPGNVFKRWNGSSSCCRAGSHTNEIMHFDRDILIMVGTDLALICTWFRVSCSRSAFLTRQTPNLDLSRISQRYNTQFLVKDYNKYLKCISEVTMELTSSMMRRTSKRLCVVTAANSVL